MGGWFGTETRKTRSCDNNRQVPRSPWEVLQRFTGDLDVKCLRYWNSQGDEVDDF